MFLVWKEGHNSASCEERKKWLAANPDTYEAAYEARKGGTTKGSQGCKCGFCKKTGHNVKTCALKETIHSKFTALNSVFRRTVLEQLCLQGVGVGALVMFRPHNGTSDPVLAVVREINWDNIHAGSDGRSYCIGLNQSFWTSTRGLLSFYQSTVTRNATPYPLAF